MQHLTSPLQVCTKSQILKEIQTPKPRLDHAMIRSNEG